MEITSLELIIWILVNFGAANGMAHSSLTFRLRNWFHQKLVVTRFKDYSTFFHCVMCQSFWTGIILSLVWISPTGFWLWDAFLSSASCWLIYLGVMNRQANT